LHFERGNNAAVFKPLNATGDFQMMNTKDAFSILNIQSGYVSQADIKLAYRKASALYHPDRNPAGLEMMKLVNLAYEVLKDFEGEAEACHEKNYGEALNNALNAIIQFGFEIELCGMWVWVNGDTRPHKEALKAAGYLWASKKMQWYFRPEKHKSFNRSSWSMKKIREKYGSEPIKSQQKKALQAN
jgi:hypothetical protein